MAKFRYLVEFEEDVHPEKMIERIVDWEYGTKDLFDRVNLEKLPVEEQEEEDG